MKRGEKKLFSDFLGTSLTLRYTHDWSGSRKGKQYTRSYKLCTIDAI